MNKDGWVYLDDPNGTFLTAEEWKQLLYPDVQILDYDGFDRSDLDYSFTKRRMGQNEFKQRMAQCTILTKGCSYPTQWFVDDGGLDVTKHEC